MPFVMVKRKIRQRDGFYLKIRNAFFYSFNAHLSGMGRGFGASFPQDFWIVAARARDELLAGSDLAAENSIAPAGVPTAKRASARRGCVGEGCIGTYIADFSVQVRRREAQNVLGRSGQKRCRRSCSPVRMAGAVVG